MESLSQLRVQLLGDSVEKVFVLNNQNNSFPQVLITLDVGRDADLMNDSGHPANQGVLDNRLLGVMSFLVLTQQLHTLLTEFLFAGDAMTSMGAGGTNRVVLIGATGAQGQPEHSGNHLVSHFGLSFLIQSWVCISFWVYQFQSWHGCTY